MKNFRKPLLFALVILCSPISAKVKGYIDGVGLSSDQKTLYIKGWACETSTNSSINTHLYVGGGAGKGTIIAQSKASLASGSGVSSACGTTLKKHRFQYSLERSLFKKHLGKSIYIHGISPLKTGNLLIGRSGVFQIPKLTKLIGVKGYIDSVSLINNAQAVRVKGWACDYNESKSINIHLYVGGAAGSGTILKAMKASAASESGVQKACGTSGVNHRFSMDPSSKNISSAYGKKDLYPRNFH